eukprot:12929053-Prorocentrum_lima.AAC.1
MNKLTNLLSIGKKCNLLVRFVGAESPGGWKERQAASTNDIYYVKQKKRERGGGRRGEPNPCPPTPMAHPPKYHSRSS